MVSSSHFLSTCTDHLLGDDFAGRPAPEVTIDPSGTSASVTHTKSGQRILRAQKQPPAPTLFLGNLGFNTTDDSIRSLFAAHRRPEKTKKTEDEQMPVEAEEKKEDWIRKVRMGTFEDTGKCKGYGLYHVVYLVLTYCSSFAFVDFSTIEHATAALVNPRNHHLDGRDLVVEYASADAVRRGASRPKPIEGTTDSHAHRPKKEYHPHPARKEREPKQFTRDKPPPHEDAPTETAVSGAERSRPEPRVKGPRSRPRPGAALAMAKRQSAAILPSAGASKKITF